MTENLRTRPWTAESGAPLPAIGPWLYRRLTPAGQARYRWDVPTQRYVLIDAVGRGCE